MHYFVRLEYAVILSALNIGCTVILGLRPPSTRHAPDLVLELSTV
jgi:hypothetical protein